MAPPCPSHGLLNSPDVFKICVRQKWSTLIGNFQKKNVSLTTFGRRGEGRTQALATFVEQTTFREKTTFRERRTFVRLGAGRTRHAVISEERKRYAKKMMKNWC